MRLYGKLATVLTLAGIGVIGLGLLLLQEISEKAYLKQHPPVICRTCHCHKEFCVRECSEETMCAMRCEGNATTEAKYTRPGQVSGGGPMRDYEYNGLN